MSSSSELQRDYDQAVRNLDGETILAIESGMNLPSDIATQPKVAAALECWKKLQEARGSMTVSKR
jgi:hypothetical protein